LVIAEEDQTVEQIPHGNGRAVFTRLVEQVKLCGKANESFRNSFAVALSLWTGIYGAASLGLPGCFSTRFNETNWYERSVAWREERSIVPSRS
jgi:hypothetical protein